MLQQLLVFLLVAYASSSHFRGGSISWDIRQNDFVANSSTVSVRLYQRYTWRRSAATGWLTSLCDASTIANGSALLLGENDLVCTSHDCENSVLPSYQRVSVQVLCTDFSVDDDYASGENYIVLQLPINKRLTYTYASCCWINLKPTPDVLNWALNVVIDTHRRVNKKFNSAPVSIMRPIVKVQIGQIYIINIPIADIDGDQIRCRWGTNSNESGSIYKPKGELQSNPCQLTYNATTIGYEGVALVIEDFDLNNEILSSIPLQFLIEIVALPSPPTTTAPMLSGRFSVTSGPTLRRPVCLIPPKYEGDWGLNACIGIASNSTIEMRIVVRIPCDNSSTSIQDIDTISPTGMTKGPITQDPIDRDKYIMYLQWTPPSEQYSIHPVCITPVDDSNLSGQTVCFNLLVDVHSPQFVRNSMSPTGVVARNQSTWTIITDADIVPPVYPSTSAVFYKKNRSTSSGDKEVIRVNMFRADYQSRQITFDTKNTIWEQDEEYYILLDGGVATTNQSCRIQSAPIIDSRFWTFSIAPEVIATTSTIPEKTMERNIWNRDNLEKN